MRKPKTIALRKSQSQVKVLERYGFDDIVSYALQVAEEVNSFKPTTYHEAITCFEADKWMMAMNEEMKSLHKNKT